MSNGFLFAFLLGSCFLGALGQENTTCIPSATLEIVSCSANHTNFLSNLRANNESRFAIMATMCSETGRIVLGCLFGVFEKCPALMNMGSNTTVEPVTSSMFPFNLTDMMSRGGICDSIKGCEDKMIKCVDKVSTNEPDWPHASPNLTQYMSDAAAFNEAKNYLLFQQLSSVACGPYKPVMECMPTIKDQCSYMKEQYRLNYDLMVKHLTHGVQNVKFMTFDGMMDLVPNCHLMPQDFGSSECLQKQLMLSEFTTCHQNFLAIYITKTESQNCNAYEALKGCFTNNVEPKCGAAMSDFIVKNTPLVLDGISSSCVTWTSGSSKPLATSAMTMMAALFVAMATLL